MNIAPTDISNSAVPDADAIRTYLEVVFGYTSGYVPVRLLTEKGTPDGRPWSLYPPADDQLSALMSAEARKAISRGRGLFVVPATVAKPGQAKAADIAETAVILIDLDSGDIAAKRDHLARYLGPPSLEIASGGKTSEGQDKLHLYWRLTEPATGADLHRVAVLREVIASKAGGDPSFASLHQPIRLAGSIHGKNGVASLVRIICTRTNDQELSDLEAAVRSMPALSGTSCASEPAPSTKTSAIAVSARDLMIREVREGGVDEVTRFEALSKVIGHWLRQARLGALSLAEAWDAVASHNAARITPPWVEVRLRREFDALLDRDHRNHPREGFGTGKGQTADDNSCHKAPDLSEDALAADFVHDVGDQWRHVAAWGQWLHWTATHWQPDETGQVRQAVRLICRAAAVGIDRPSDARRIASQKTFAAVERVAASDPAISAGAADWDTDSMLLNVQSGIIDLVTGEITAHDPAQMMTRLAGAAVGRECPRWVRFLTEITGDDPDLVGYLQRFCGYCLTGSMTEQVFVFLHGQGANGKSVFLQVLTTILGSYATTAPLETFMAAHGDRHPTDLAGLRGARMVTVPETETGRAWAESRIKIITGGDPIKARFMHRDFFEFRPTFKLIIAGNHRPHLTGVGEAMRRRLHLVPFSVTIPPEQRDKTLTDTLLAERDGILGWILQGCLDWQRIGLAPPATVLEAARQYFDDEDLVGQWIAEQCVTGPEHRASSAELYTSWSAFAERYGIDKGTAKSLAEALQQKGYMRIRTQATRGWQGIAVKRHSRDEGATA